MGWVPVEFKKQKASCHPIVEWKLNATTDWQLKLVDEKKRGEESVGLCMVESQIKVVGFVGNGKFRKRKKAGTVTLISFFCRRLNELLTS